MFRIRIKVIYSKIYTYIRLSSAVWRKAYKWHTRRHERTLPTNSAILGVTLSIARRLTCRLGGRRSPNNIKANTRNILHQLINHNWWANRPHHNTDYNRTKMRSNCLSIVCTVFLCFSVFPSQSFDLPSAGAKTIHRLYLECARADDGFSPCLKKRAITFVDRLTNMETLPLAEGLQVVKTGVPVALKSVEDLSSTRSLQERDLELTNMLIERVANYLNTRTMEITFPPITSDELGRSVEEGS